MTEETEMSESREYFKGLLGIEEQRIREVARKMLEGKGEEANDISREEVMGGKNEVRNVESL